MSLADSKLDTEMTEMDDQESAHHAPCRPSDFARLMLAGPGLRSRERARDQQADQAGIALKRQVLTELSALDPEPESFDIALDQIITQLGPPYGPVRGICLSVRNDWQAACSSPQFLAWLLQEAISEDRGPRRGKRRAD